MGHKKFGVQVSVQLPPASKARAELMAVDAGVRAAEMHRRVYEAGLEALDAGGAVSGWRDRIEQWEEMAEAASVEARRRRAVTAGRAGKLGIRPIGFMLDEAIASAELAEGSGS